MTAAHNGTYAHLMWIGRDCQSLNAIVGVMQRASPILGARIVSPSLAVRVAVPEDSKSARLASRDRGGGIPNAWSTEVIWIKLHGLRHTMASLALQNGVDIATVSERLGHADTNITARIYLHGSKESDRAAADALDTALHG